MSLSKAVEKSALRKLLRETLKVNLTADSVDLQSRSVCDRLIASPTFRRSKAVSVYLSRREGEVCTDAIVQAVFEQDKKLYVPLFWNRREMDMVCIQSYSEFLALPRNDWGIREPRVGAEVTLETPLLDLIVMPGLAFDQDGNRLGQGMGLYDRFIKRAELAASRLQADPPITVALALREQLLACRIRVDEWDVKPDVILYSDRTVTPPLL